MSMVPYPFQRRVAELLLSGRNVILQAPTGAGKTMAAMLPFLETIEHGRDFPHKCLYAVPMRVLANQFVEEFTGKVRQAGRDDRIRVAIQTGEHADDEYLSATLTFATIDQVLSSFLLSPYSLPRRLSNLNAGAVVASYLVFDEFHLFDPLSTLPTTLEMLRTLRGVTPFLLMTATFSSDMLDGLASALDAVVVPEDDDTRQAMGVLPSQQKTRRCHVTDGPLCADALLAQHRNRTLVVCNVVDRARALFETLRAHPDLGETQVLLLHSRFLPEDRQRIEGKIRKLFSKGEDSDSSGSWIVIATQVVEVGLDITCQALHTELAPANAVLQRAGRCARYPGEEGDVFVYAETFNAEGETVDLTENVMPYKDQKEEVACTLAEFRDRNGDTLTFGDEQAIISAAHGPRDRAIVEGLVATQEMHRRKMNSVMDGQRSGEAGDLIRAVSSRLVVVHDNPLAVAEHPFAAEAFSLHPGTLYGLVKKWLEREWDLDLDDGYGVHALHDLGDVDELGRSAYRWLPVQDRDDVVGSALVLVHPALAGYDHDLGFVPDRGTGYRARLTPARDTTSRGGYAYRLEDYAEHVRLVYQAFLRHVWPELAPAATRLESTCGWPAGVVERAAHLVVLLHDVGKLNKDWQSWVVRYQKAIGRPAPAGFYAHTDFDPTNALHRKKQKSLRRKPPHAVEGAVAVAPLLVVASEECMPVFNAAFTAIARHHGAFTREYRRYALAPAASLAVAKTLAWLPPPLMTGIDAGDLLINEDPAQTQVDNLLVEPRRDEEFLAYVLLARALRRADQAGTMMGSS
ncbi:MAG: CRISPR-associated helicase Cas3' [Chloroflexota bacterium]|nr:CRISPR-associated helicase Cas3' [Chloroflexota bacterium]